MKQSVYIKKINLTIEDFTSSYSSYIGDVYPNDSESYFIGSGADFDLYEIRLKDGSLYAEHTMRELAEAGYPHIAEEYDREAYEAAIERFNASVGMDERPPFPTPEAFEINVSEEQIPDVEWDLDLEEEYEN